MTTTTTATRPRARTSRPASSTAAVPRLLLPPIAEPAAEAPPRGRTASAPVTRAVRSPVTAAAWGVPPRTTPQEDPVLPDPTRLCGAVVLAAVEALRSSRPLAQLARWVSPAVYEALSRAARPGESEGHRSAAIRGLRVCRVSPTVAEGSAVVHDGTRVRAAAVRFEVHRGAWRVTALQIG